MFESCSRCASPAGTVMSYDYAERAVWLDDLRRIEPGDGYVLCAEHGDRLTPPVGWTLADRRTSAQLFAPLEVA